MLVSILEFYFHQVPKVNWTRSKWKFPNTFKINVNPLVQVDMLEIYFLGPLIQISPSCSSSFSMFIVSGINIITRNGCTKTLLSIIRGGGIIPLISTTMMTTLVSTTIGRNHTSNHSRGRSHMKT